MPSSPPFQLLLLVITITSTTQTKHVAASQWCIARSEASNAALQSALDYACGKGVADCQPLQPSGLCFLPNTLQSHASYAFNSFFQRSRAAPGSCDFSGTATTTITDPSYGSCTFPSSASTAGGAIGQQTPNTSPTITNSPNTNGNASPIGNGIGGLTPVIGGSTPANGLTPNAGGFNSGFGSQVPSTDQDYSASHAISAPLWLLPSSYILLLVL